MSLLLLFGAEQEEEPEVAFPTTTTVLDDFNREDANDLGANWTQFLTAFTGDRNFRVAINRARGLSAGTTRQVWWNADSFDADQEAWITLSVVPADGETFSLWLRITNIGEGTTDGYLFRLTMASGADTFDIRRMDNAVSTVLDSATATVASGDQIGASAIGDTLTFHHRPSGGEWVEVLSVTDATYSTGGRIGMDTLSLADAVDNFGGGSVVTAEGATSSARRTLTGVGT